MRKNSFSLSSIETLAIVGILGFMLFVAAKSYRTHLISIEVNNLNSDFYNVAELIHRELLEIKIISDVIKYSQKKFWISMTCNKNLKLRDNSSLKEACKILSNGELVIIPTETVYGIACDPENSYAVKKLQEIKGRDKNKPISYLAGSIDQVKNVCINWNNGIENLCKKYWPGPLTLVLETKKDWLGFRVPNHNVPILVCNTYGNFTISCRNF